MFVGNKNSSNNSKTKGVETLLGDPKKAVIKLAVPMIIAMSAHTIYNLVDAVWVSGFGQDIFTSNIIIENGTDALAAVGYALPFYMMLLDQLYLDVLVLKIKKGQIIVQFIQL